MLQGLGCVCRAGGWTQSHLCVLVLPEDAPGARGCVCRAGDQPRVTTVSWGSLRMLQELQEEQGPAQSHCSVCSESMLMAPGAVCCTHM